MFDLDMFTFNELLWVPKVVKADDFHMADINYKILGLFLKNMMEAENNWKKVVGFFRQNRGHTILEATNKHLAMEKADILKELEEMLGSFYGPIIIKILTGEMITIEEMSSTCSNDASASPRKVNAEP